MLNSDILDDSDFTIEFWYKQEGNNMRTVTIAVSDLLRKLKENREQHVKDYNEALDGWKILVAKELKEKQKTLQKTGDISFQFKSNKPTSYESEFDDIIAMMEWTTDKEVELEQSDFKRYVQNQWSWMNSFTATTMAYKGIKG